MLRHSKYTTSFLLFLLAIGFAFGQNTTPLNMRTKESRTASRVTQYLNTKLWNELFPNRYRKKNIDFYTFAAFTAAAKRFPSFLSEGNNVIRKRELAAFLANIAQETSGGWPEAEGGYFKWGLYFLEEQDNGQPLDYTDYTRKLYPPVSGKMYYGRGPKQMSWNYNYGQFSEAWFGNKDTLLQHPELLTQDPVLSFASALWFWMTPQPPKPSCHDIMTEKWVPTPNDVENGRVPGFGATVNVINGGIECGRRTDLDKTKYRYQYYQYFCRYLHVTPGSNITCTDQKPFGQ